MNTIKSTAKIGFEFTFSCANESDSWTKDVHLFQDAPLDKYYEFVDKFVTYMEVPPGKIENEGLGRVKEKILRLEFNDAFWIQTSLDDGVIEIQTQPVTSVELNSAPIKDILGKMFSYFNTNGYKAGDGGGHINVDYITGFQGDFDLIRRTIRATEFLYTDPKRSELADSSYEKLNPFIKTDRVVAIEEQDKVLEYKQNPIDLNSKNMFDDWMTKIYIERNPVEFKKKYAIWLFRYPTIEQFYPVDKRLFANQFIDDEANLCWILRNQAINIAHLYETSNAADDPRRLEFRFFKAQNGMDAINEGINFIKQIVDRALTYHD